MASLLLYNKVKYFKWSKGRQDSGYFKMPLCVCRFLLKFDAYLLKYPSGSSIAKHRDEVDCGRHYRINVVLNSKFTGGKFICDNPIWESKRIKFFRPDISEHSLTKIESGTRYVLSVGWKKK